MTPREALDLPLPVFVAFSQFMHDAQQGGH